MPIHFAARAVSASPFPVGRVSLAPVALDGITQRWNAALVADPDAAALRLTDPDHALLAATTPDQPATSPTGDTIVAQVQHRLAAFAEYRPAGPRPAGPGPGAGRAGATIPLSLPAVGKATLPIAQPGSPCAFIAASGLGQPGIEAERGMDVAKGTAFALCGGPRLTAWNAGGTDPLRLRLRRYDLAVQPEAAVDAVFSGTLPPHAAVPLRLPAGLKRLDVSLASGSALVAGWHPRPARPSPPGPATHR